MRAAVCLFIYSLLLPAGLLAQGYGQNQVVTRDFEWTIRSTEHFDIHYYEGSAHLVPEAAEILERSYQKISKELDAGFTQKRPFFLYANVNDMEQSNIVQVGDGTGGVTEASKDRFMVYNDGTMDWLDDVITHELTHVFQYSILVSGFWKSARILKSFVYPLWMMEGGAELSTGNLDETTGEVYVRDAATSNGLIPLWKMEHFSHLKPHQITLAYKSGESAMRFLYDQYGSDKVGKMFKLFESRFEVSSVLQTLVGLDIFAFDKKWREYEEEKYRRVVRIERLQEPSAFGTQLTRPTAKTIPEFNTSPVFTPDGRRMAYLSTRDGYPPILMLQDLAAGKRKQVVAYTYTRIENIMLGNFTNISRVLAISPNGNTLVFSGQKNHVDSLYFYDIARKKLRTMHVPGFMSINQPAFSPDGGKVAFSGMKEGYTDIYLLDLKTEKVTQLTSDPHDDQSPNFSPDGQSIVFSSEIQVPDAPRAASGQPSSDGVSEGGLMRYQRRLYRLKLADLSMERIEEVPGAARDPVYSADGKRIVFTLDGFGFTDIYEMETDTGKISRLTRTIGGSYAAAYAPDGDIAFCSFRRGSIHVYRGPRDKFLAESVVTDLPADSAPAFLTSISSPGVSGFSVAASSIAEEGRRANRREAVVGKPFAQVLPGLEATPVKPQISSETWSGSQVSTGPAVLSPPRPYKFSASTDLFIPAAFYSSLGGLFWTSYWQGSDMLGNHQLQNVIAYNSGAGYVNYQTGYQYSRYRPQLVIGAQGVVQRDLIDPSNGLTNNVSDHTQFIGVRYPFDRFHRLELLTSAVETRQGYPDLGSNINQDGRLVSASLIRDTVTGRYLIANRGSRFRTTYSKAAEVLGGNVENYTFSGEADEYFDTGGQSALVLRSLASGSWGPNAVQYQLGGLTGVRGYGTTSIVGSTPDNAGNHFTVATAEWRFPIVENLDYYMWFFFPDFYFKAIYGAVFTDAGYAWNSKQDVSLAHWNSVRNSAGLGIRIHTFILQLFPLVVQFDYARRTTSNGGVFYVYLGPLF